MTEQELAELQALKAELAGIKELLLTKLLAQEKLTEERFLASNQALKIQASEYERRLRDLNGEAGRLRAMQSTYLPREIYENQHQNIINQLEENLKYRARTEGKSQGISAVWVILVVVIGFFISIAGLVISAIR